MKVTELSVGGYRNLCGQKVLPESGLNIFLGDNAQGKTNLVESVYLCCIGKSPRTDRDKDLIRWGEKTARVTTKYVCRYGEGEISVALYSDKKKQITVNSVPVARTGELMGYLNCIYFSPDEIKIISRSPAERRRFLDIDLCQTDKNYFYSLSRFNKALNQRNNLLKQARSAEELKETIFIWDKQIAEEGARVIYKRKAFCEKLKLFARQSHEKLTDGKESLMMEYVTQIKGSSLAEITAEYLRILTACVEKDFQLRYTSNGCQRDDISLRIGNADLRNFGSQGQLRTAALALKLAELCIFKEINGEYPVLLLDDVLSELDAERQKRLLKFDENLQILLTTATPLPEELTKELSYASFTIKNGKAEKKV